MFADCCGISTPITTNFKLLTCCHRTGSWKDKYRVICKSVPTQHWAQLSKCDTVRSRRPSSPVRTETRAALWGTHTLWVTGEQRSGNRVVRSLHKRPVGTGCRQEPMALGQTRTICEDSELPSRGKTKRTVGGGMGLEATLFCR